MKRNEAVTKIMSKQPLTVHTGMKLSEVRAMFSEHGIHHLPVVSGEKLVGIISTTDIFRVAFGSSGAEIDNTLDHTSSIEQVMSKNPATVATTDTVRTAAELLSEGAFHSLPVIEGEKLVGIVTSTDLIKYLLDQY